MFSNLGFSLFAALAILAAAARPTHAGSATDFAAMEAGIPDSVDYAHRMPGSRFPSAEEIEALESGNPDSVGYRDGDVDSTGDASQVAFGAPEYPFEAF